MMITLGSKNKYYICFIATLVFSTSAFAAEKIADTSSTDDGMVAIYGSTCEKIGENEQKSTVRVRATDKASFLAVGAISALADFKKQMSDHDFNVMTYSIVDNLIEDMAVRTTRQDEQEICVEITGFINGDELVKAVNEFVTAQGLDEDETDDEKYFGDTKPEGVDKKPIVVEQKAEIKYPELSAEEKAQMEGKKAYLYVAPTEFFDGTRSSKYSDITRKQFKSDYYYAAGESKGADYVIIPKILRAKVDPINANTNRLQMVVSVEVKSKNVNLVEHQNRFILFASSENEQQTALNLMKELLEKAGENIKEKVEQNEIKKVKERTANLPTVITPTQSSATSGE